MCCASVPGAPLSGTDFNVELLLTCADREVPLLYYSCPAAGGNSPASLMGSMVLATADWLGALVMHQLKRPGAPVCSFGFTMQLMEMRTLIWSYNAPEMQLAYGAVADLAHWYGLPAWGIVVESDAPLLDAQAGAEMSAATMWALLSRMELAHNIGRSGAGKTISAEAAVLADEIIASARSAVQPVAAQAEELEESVRLINEMGPNGEYVTHRHTLRHCRDFWYPSVFDRAHFDPQSRETGTALGSRLTARAAELTETARSQRLPRRVEGELLALERSWYARAGRGGRATQFP
jgi:trimethylamine--corrinoid protein Co-methyltransferase